MARTKRSILLVAYALVLCSAAFSDTAAQSYPTRSVTIIAATTPGSLPDVIARAVGQRLASKWLQPVVVENRAGGAYAIAASAVAGAAPDGHTLLVTESGFFTTQPHLSKRTAYRQADFVPVSGLAGIPTAMIASPSIEAKSIPELLALAKAKPASINYGTAGPGTSPHMGMLLFENAAQVKLTAVHYRGVSPILNDLIAGHIQLALIGPTIALPAYKGGQVKILGVGSERPIPQLEGVAPIAESVPGFEMSVSFSIFVRTGTPQDIIDRVNADAQEIVRDPAFQKQFLEPQALQAVQGTPKDFSRLMQNESDRWARLVRETNLVID